LRNNESSWNDEDKFWDDKYSFDEKEWQVILVDFGFAKALTQKEVGASCRASVKQLFEKQASQHGLMKKGDNDKPPTIMNRRFSFECRPIKGMSAVGTKAFAAPEVTKARTKSSTDEALTNCVSDYGFISDSYSVGSTIKVLLTGVPADVTDVMGFMSANSNPLLNILSTIFSCGKKNKRRKRYKFLDETPKPARELIAKLMKIKAEERLAVPLAKDEPWIKGGCTKDDPVVILPEGDIVVGHTDPVVCLRCSVHR
jgi:serine/threonine protein kinase